MHRSCLASRARQGVNTVNMHRSCLVSRARQGVNTVNMHRSCLQRLILRTGAAKKPMRYRDLASRLDGKRVSESIGNRRPCREIQLRSCFLSQTQAFFPSFWPARGPMRYRDLASRLDGKRVSEKRHVFYDAGGLTELDSSTGAADANRFAVCVDLPRAGFLDRGGGCQ